MVLEISIIISIDNNLIILICKNNSWYGERKSDFSSICKSNQLLDKNE